MNGVLWLQISNKPFQWTQQGHFIGEATLTLTLKHRGLFFGLIRTGNKFSRQDAMGYELVSSIITLIKNQGFGAFFSQAKGVLSRACELLTRYV